MSGLPATDRSRFNWSDYRSWSKDERWEIIGGEAFAMTPAPLTRHQRIATRLSRLLGNFFKGGPCELLAAPTDLKLSEEDIVQPDLLVVCDPDQIKRTHVEGPPSLVIEILSPDSLKHDRVVKMELYARFGVPEYWIVTPYPSMIEVFVLQGDAYRLQAGYVKEDTLRSPSFPELELVLAPVFDFPVDPEEQVTLIKEGRPAYAAAGT